MPSDVGVILFFALFVGAGVLIFILASKQRKRWRARPAILRALANRRGYRYVENPGTPSDLVPIRPLERAKNLTAMELPAAVQGRTIDGDAFTIFDVYTEQKSGSGNNVSYPKSFETFITITSRQTWPHFEFAAISHSTENSMEGTLMSMVGNMAELLMKDRGLTHVPILDRPGYQLFVGDQQSATPLRDALVRIFDSKGPWWVGGLDDALTLQVRSRRSMEGGTLVAERELDRFIDDALAIARDLRRAIRL